MNERRRKFLFLFDEESVTQGQKFSFWCLILLCLFISLNAFDHFLDEASLFYFISPGKRPLSKNSKYPRVRFSRRKKYVAVYLFLFFFPSFRGQMRTAIDNRSEIRNNAPVWLKESSNRTTDRCIRLLPFISSQSNRSVRFSRDQREKKTGNLKIDINGM